MKRSRCRAVAPAAPHTKTMTAGNPAATRCQLSTITTRMKKYAPAT